MSVDPRLKWLRIYEWGGVNDTDASTIIAANQAQSMNHAIIRRAGALEKRHRKLSYGGATTPTAATAVRGLFRAYYTEPSDGPTFGKQIREIDGSGDLALQGIPT